MKLSILILSALAAFLGTAWAADTSCCDSLAAGGRPGWIPTLGAVRLGRGDTAWDLVVHCASAGGKQRPVCPEEGADCCPVPPQGRFDLTCCPQSAPSVPAACDSSCKAPVSRENQACEGETTEKGCSNVDCR